MQHRIQRNDLLHRFLLQRSWHTDTEASAEASDAAYAAAERIREYTILKTDGAHAH